MRYHLRPGLEMAYTRMPENTAQRTSGISTTSVPTKSYVTQLYYGYHRSEFAGRNHKQPELKRAFKGSRIPYSAYTKTLYPFLTAA
ncbi:hypothetical protein WOLCODRAFT_21909 [Wolfiporia cocos MD-104 SS10]|uniref:Uncharacterized protein n=1 Tax=Wolfiporia cocos (strain MD-104) TaxID=742152 RepID=A0A2H3J6P2_WOLCO|nr:hypothetical protein WOLCODRAFT_21909 [Wolfiporia cocos MD-104 SS10]